MPTWEIIKADSRNDFYNQVTKFELRGYVLIPESYTIGGGSTKRIYSALMKIG